MRLFLGILLVAISATGADWRQFRGNAGVAAEGDGPGDLSTNPVVWKRGLPGEGVSSPIVVGDKLFVTCSSGADQERLHLICFSVANGAEIWHRQFWATGRTMCHTKTAVATPTPISNGELIVAQYSSNDIICLDLDGNLKWMRGLTADYANASNSLGMASSPAIAGDTVIVQVENDAESFAAGLSLADGRNLWKLDRPKSANWTSPVSVGHNRALLQSKDGVSMVSALDGRELWAFEGGAATIPSSTLSGDLLLIPSNGLTAMRAKPEGSGFEPAWRSAKLRPGTASPIIAGDRAYVLTGGGILSCADTTSGDVHWKLRIEGPHSATPVLAGDLLYLINEEGVVQVVRVSDDAGEIITQHELGETVLCTPAIAGKAMYLRSDKTLWKLGPG
jgi:outer membrane protein assembly factor BamB